MFPEDLETETSVQGHLRSVSGSKTLEEIGSRGDLLVLSSPFLSIRLKRVAEPGLGCFSPVEVCREKVGAALALRRLWVSYMIREDSGQHSIACSFSVSSVVQA